MNRKPSGLLQHKMAEGLSPNTLKAYESVLKMWASPMRDKSIKAITSGDVREHFAWLRNEYKPKRMSCKDHPLSNKTIH